MNFKKVLSIVISISLVACISPNIVFAEKDEASIVDEAITEPVAEVTSGVNKSAESFDDAGNNSSILALQQRIDALPTVDEFKELDKSKQAEIYQEIQSIADEVDKLFEEEQTQLDMIKVINLSEFINSLTDVTLTLDKTKISTSDLRLYDSGNLKSVVVSFVWPNSNSASINLVCLNKDIGDGNTLYQTYQGKWTSYASSRTGIESATGAKVVSYSSNSISAKYNNTVSATMSFSEQDVPLTKNQKYYIYVWSYWGGYYYPDAQVVELNVSNGNLNYKTPGDSSYSDIKEYHTHKWSYALSGNTIEAYCTETSYSSLCDYQVANKRKLTLTANNSVYSGGSYGGATISNTIPAVSGSTPSSITYVGRGSTSYASSTTPPTNAGTYTARVSIAGYTATQDFTISKASISPSVTLSNWTYGGTPQTPKITGNTGSGDVTYQYKPRGSADSSYETVSDFSSVPAGSYTLKANIAETTNYASGSATFDFVVNKMGITPTVSISGWTYDGQDNCNPTVSGNTGGGNVTYKYYSDSACMTEVTSVKNAGTYYVKAIVSETDNYTAGESNAKEFIVSQKELTADITSPGGTFSGTITPATATLTGVIDGDDVDVTLTYKGNTNAGVAYDSEATPTQAGTYKVYATITDSNYTLPETSENFIVERAEAGLTADSSKSATYNDADFDITATTNTEAKLGFESKNADVVTVSDNGKVHIVGAGNTTIEVTSPETANYKSATKTVTISIAKADPEVTAPVAKTNLVYTGQDLELVTAGATTGGELQYKVGEGNWSTDIPTGTDAGTYTVYYKVVGDNNYNDVAELSFEVNISLSDITVTENAYAGTYDGAEHESTVTADVEGAKIEYKKQNETSFSENAPKYKYAGTYKVDYKVSKANYKTVEGQFTVKIDKLKVAVSGITAENKTYDKTTSAALNFDNVVVDKRVAADDLSVTAKGEFVSAEVGIRDVIISELALSGSDIDNYELDSDSSQGTTAATINPKGLTADITSPGGTYAGTITPATATLTGVVDGDDEDVTLTYKGNTNAGVTYDSEATPTQAGTYKVYATITDSNYTLPETSENFIVERAEAGLNIDDIPEKHYLDEDFDLEVTHDSDGQLTFESSDKNVATISTSGTVSINGVGTTKFTVSIAETVNYKGGIAEVELNVKKIPHKINVVSSDIEKVYGDSGFNLDVTADDNETDLKYESTDSDIVSVDNSGNVTVHKAGDADIKVSMDESGDYSEAEVSIKVTVSPKPITVKAKDASKKFNTDDPEFVYEVLNSGLVGSDALNNIQLTREAGEDYKKGGYKITASAEKDDNPNYDITFEAGILTIVQIDLATAEVYLGDVLRYSGDALAQNIDSVVVEGLNVEENSYVVSGNTATDPGVYTLTISAKEDCNFSGKVTWTYVVVPEMIQAKDDTIDIGKGKITFVEELDVKDIDANIADGIGSLVDTLIDGEEVDANELSAVADGAEIKIVWTVRDITDTIDSDSKDLIVNLAKADDFTVDRFVDLDLSKIFIHDGEETEEAIFETSDDIEVSMTIPEDIVNKDEDNINRKYDVYRNHDSSVSALGATYDKTRKQVFFKTNKFSDYALAYSDSNIPHDEPITVDPTTPEAQTPSVKTASPITGDSAKALITLFAFVVCALLAGLFISYKNRRNAQVHGLHYRK